MKIFFPEAANDRSILDNKESSGFAEVMNKCEGEKRLSRVIAKEEKKEEHLLERSARLGGFDKLRKRARTERSATRVLLSWAGVIPPTSSPWFTIT